MSEWSPTPFPPPTTPADETAPWRRLDPRMLLVNPVQELIRFLPIVIGAFVLGSAGDQNTWQLLGIAIPVVIGVVRFLTTRYRITATQVELQRGLIGRKVLTARLDRVRAVELTSSPIHRVLGLAKVEIGTASGAKQDEDKFVLDGLPLPQAREMRVALLHRLAPGTRASAGTSGVAGPGGAPDLAGPDLAGPDLAGPDLGGPDLGAPGDVVLLDFDRRWVRYAPLTSSGNVIAAGVLAVLGQFGEALGDRLRIDVGMVDWVTGQSLANAIPLVASGLLVAFLVLGAVFSVLGYLISNWGFTLSRDAHGRSFNVRRGLLTNTETSLERRRVRGLEVREPLGLRLAGAARLAAIVTGVSREESSSSQIVPPAPRAIVDATGAEVLEVSEPLHLPLRQHGPAARRRRYTRALVGALALPVVAAVLAALTPVAWWVVLPMLLALPVGLLLAADRYRRLGHGLTEDYLVVRSGSLSGRRDVLQRSGIIGWNIQQSWFQRRAGLVTLVATTAAGQQAYAAIDIPEATAVALAHSAVPDLLTPFLA